MSASDYPANLWRVIDDNNCVVCTAFREDHAEEITAAHNANDPIQSREDWLFYRDN